MSQRCLFVVLFLIAVTVIGNSKQFHVLEKRDNCASCTASAPCCSQYGFCGSTADYCGVGCQSGPCTGSSSEDDDNDNGTGIITKAIFRCAFPLLNASLLHRRFGGLKKTGWSPANIVAGAVFLAHVSHETDGLRTLVEYCAATNACGNYQTSWCAIQAKPGKLYYGRGWFQLSYPCNYWNAGKALGLDLLANPDRVAQSNRIAAATAIWYYTATGMNIPAAQGNFANTTRILNIYECTGHPGQNLQASRVATYQFVRKCFGLAPATQNLYC